MRMYLRTCVYWLQLKKRFCTTLFKKWLTKTSFRNSLPNKFYVYFGKQKQKMETKKKGKRNDTKHNVVLAKSVLISTKILFARSNYAYSTGILCQQEEGEANAFSFSIGVKACASIGSHTCGKQIHGGAIKHGY